VAKLQKNTESSTIKAKLSYNSFNDLDILPYE